MLKITKPKLKLKKQLLTPKLLARPLVEPSREMITKALPTRLLKKCL